MTTADTTPATRAFDPFEIDWSDASDAAPVTPTEPPARAAVTTGPATGPVVAAPAAAPGALPTNVQPAGCSRCGAACAAGQGTVITLDGARTTVRCRRCHPRPDLAPAFVAPPVAASPAAALVAAAVGLAAATERAIATVGVPARVRFERCPEPGRVALVSPFLAPRDGGRECRDELKRLAGGVWHREHGTTGAWYILAAHVADIRPTLRRYYGTDGGPLPVDPVRSAATVAPVGTAIAAALTPATVDTASANAEALRAGAAEARARLVAAREAAAARATATAAASAATTTEAASVSAAMLSRDIIAGARVEGQGALVSWEGEGSRTRAEILRWLAAAELPEDWAPEAKSREAHLGRAVEGLSRGGLIPRKDRKLSRLDARTIAARWVVGSLGTGAEVGDALGRVQLTATLTRDGRLTLDGDPELTADVRRTYDELVSGEVYSAADITGWLGSLLRRELGAVRLGLHWYLRAGAVETAERLIEVVSQGWGGSWCPPLPVATSKQLRAGVAKGLQAEVADALRKWQGATDAARKATGKTDAAAGPAAAATGLKRIGEVASRLAAYAAILEPAEVAAVRASIDDARATLEPLTNDTSVRGAMLDLD